MGKLLTENMGTIIVGAVLLAAVVGIVARIVTNNRKGKCTGCGCGCESIRKP